MNLSRRGFHHADKDLASLLQDIKSEDVLEAAGPEKICRYFTERGLERAGSAASSGPTTTSIAIPFFAKSSFTSGNSFFMNSRSKCPGVRAAGLIICHCYVR